MPLSTLATVGTNFELNCFRNGARNETGTQVCIFLRILHGELDGILRCPLYMNATVIRYGVHGGWENVITHSSSEPDHGFPRPPLDSVAASGKIWGWNRFIAYYLPVSPSDSDTEVCISLNQFISTSSVCL